MNKIEKVKSSNLDSICYHERHHLLDIKFVGGSVYRYFLVPQLVYNQLTFAGSKGVYYNESIKQKFHGLKLQDPNDMSNLFLRTAKYWVVDNEGNLCDQRETESGAQQTAIELAQKFPGSNFYTSFVVGKAYVPTTSIFNKL